MVRKKRLWLRLFVGFVLDIRRRLVVFIAIFVLLLDWGKLTEDTRCRIF